MWQTCYQTTVLVLVQSKPCLGIDFVLSKQHEQSYQKNCHKNMTKLIEAKLFFVDENKLEIKNDRPWNLKYSDQNFL